MKIDLISEAVLAKLNVRVTLNDTDDAAQLIADAINTYVDLGTRAKDGATFFTRAGPEAPLRRLRFPFEDQGAFRSYRKRP